MQINRLGQAPLAGIQHTTRTTPASGETNRNTVPGPVQFEGRLRNAVKHTRNALLGLTAASGLLCAGSLGLLLADNVAHTHNKDILTSTEAEWRTMGTFAMGFYGVPIVGVPAAALAAGERLTRRKPEPDTKQSTPAVQFGGMRKVVKNTGNALLGLAAASALVCAGSLGLLKADQIAEQHGKDILPNFGAEMNAFAGFAGGLLGTAGAGVPGALLVGGERLTRKKPSENTSVEATQTTTGEAV